jgi:malonyl-CoA O-methyltransferase
MPELNATTAPVPRLDPQAVRRARARTSQAPETPWLHDEVARRMAERLSLIRQAPATVLDWSLDGGQSAPALHEATRKAAQTQVHRPAWAPAVPARQEGWRASVRRWWGRGHAPVAEADVAPGAAALVWSNMALHFEEQPPALMAQWRRALQVEGYVMFSTLGPGSLAQLRAIYRDAGWPAPHAPFVDMHDLGDMLVEAGFADPVMDQEVLTLTYADPQRLLIDLRQLGGNTAPSRFGGCRTPAWRARLLAALRERADAQGRIALDFEVVYGHAFRAPDRGPAVAPVTTVGLDDMKLMLRKPKAGA